MSQSHNQLLYVGTTKMLKNVVWFGGEEIHELNNFQQNFFECSEIIIILIPSFWKTPKLKRRNFNINKMNIY